MVASYYFVAICIPTMASLALSLDYYYRQPSPMLLRTYLFMVCFADVARIWNYQLSANNWVVSLLSLSTALVNATLLLSETYVKSPGSITSISKDFFQEKGEDELSNRSLLERLKGLLGFGFRTWTAVEDLPQLADDLSAVTLSQEFEPIWASSKFSPCIDFILLFYLEVTFCIFVVQLLLTIFSEQAVVAGASQGYLVLVELVVY